MTSHYPPILTLSTELLLQIISLTPPESHLDFAIACQHLYTCSLDTLRRHQNAYRKYRVTSDLNPVTIPTLLRGIFGKGDFSIELWHVRSIEIWRDRWTWEEWKVYNFLKPLVVEDGESSEIVAWEYREGEISEFLEGLGGVVGDDGGVFEEADAQVRKGMDGVLKVLLLMHCSRLRDLRFVVKDCAVGSCLWWLGRVVEFYVMGEPQAPKGFETWVFGEGDDGVGDGDYVDEDEDVDVEEAVDEDEDEEDESGEEEEFEMDILELEALKLGSEDEDYLNNWLDEDYDKACSLTREYASEAHVDVLRKYWPPGLFSLLNVAVGIPSSTWLDIRSDTPSTNLLCTLFRLPNISSLYYKDVRHDNNDNTDYMLTLPVGCSSLRHLFLDNCDGDHNPYLFTEALAGAPRSLLTAAFRSGDNHLEHSDDFVSSFGRHQGANLTSLMFYDYGRDAHGTIHGYRCTAYKPDEFDKFGVIKQLSISISDIELGCLYQNYDRSAEDPEFYVKYASTCLPASLECLVLWDEPGSGHAGEKEGENGLFERAVVKMIQDKTKDYSHQGIEEEKEDKVQKAESDMTEQDKEKERQRQYDNGEGEEYQKDVDSGLDPTKHYANLKAVYLEEMERRNSSNRHRYRNPHRQPRTALCFQDAVAIGRKEGVDVHTLTNRGPMEHEMEFPEAPDMYSLESGPHWETRPRDWVFDPYIGRRVPQGCGKCGKCEECLEEYSKEAWESLGDGGL